MNDIYDITYKALDCICLEGAYAIDDAIDIRMKYWMEESEKKKNILLRLIESVKKFFDKLIAKIKDIFTGKQDKEVEEIAKDSKKLKEKKVKISKKNDVIKQECEKTSKELDKCKTVDDVEKVMKRHQKRMKAAKAITATVVITGVAAYGIYKHNKNAEEKRLRQDTKKTVDDISQAYKLAVKSEAEAKNAQIERNKEIVKEATKATTNPVVAAVKNTSTEVKTAMAGVDGKVDGAVAVAKAREQVATESAKAVVNQTAEAVRGIAGGHPIQAVNDAISNTHEDIGNAHDKAAKQLGKDASALKERSDKLSNNIAKCIKYLNRQLESGNDLKDEKSQKCLRYLNRNNINLKYANNKYEVVKTGEINEWQRGAKHHIQASKGKRTLGKPIELIIPKR